LDLPAATTPGVVLEIKVPLSQVVKSPSLKEVLLIQDKQIVNEAEVLIQGIIKGAKVTKVPGSN